MISTTFLWPDSLQNEMENSDCYLTIMTFTDAEFCTCFFLLCWVPFNFLFFILITVYKIEWFTISKYQIYHAKK